MAETAIEFDKSLQDRLEEYKDIFTSSSEAGDESCTFTANKCVPGSQMKDIWRNHLSVVLQPKGWKALWRVSLGKCFLMNIKYPSDVLVEVSSIVWDTLSADVQVLRIDNDDVPPSKRIAALSELFPIEQTIKGHDPWVIANELDKYRFFYEHVWYPWDEYDDDAANWSDTHLETRLQLLYDMVTGEVSAGDTERIRYLICEARTIQAEIEETEVLIEEFKGDLNDEEHHDYIKDDKEDLEILSARLNQMGVQNDYNKRMQKEKEETLVVHLVELQRQMESIQHEVETLEDPFLRNAMANEKKRRHKTEFLMNSSEFLSINNNENKKKGTISLDVALIWGKSSIDKLRASLAFIESKFSKEIKCGIGIYPNLQQAVDEGNEKNTSFFVCSGLHKLRHTEELLYPGTTITGFSKDLELNPSVIMGQSLGKVMIVVDWLANGISTKDGQETARLENLHFDPYGVEAVLLIDKGAVCVSNCYISHEEGHGCLPLIGEFTAPSTSVLQTYSRRQSICKISQHACGDALRDSMPYLPVSAAFECPPQRGIAVGAGGKLEAVGCQFEGLHLGVIVYSGAKVSLSSCKFSQCRVAIRITKGAEVVIDKCIFDHNKVHSVHICVGTPEEQDKEIQEIMGGEDEVVTSYHVLQRIPGITFKDCIFISSECSDVRLSSVGEVVNFSNSKDGIGSCYTNQAMEDDKDELDDSEVVWIDDKESTGDDSIIVLTQNIK